jgi:hypothetical protein
MVCGNDDRSIDRVLSLVRTPLQRAAAYFMLSASDDVSSPTRLCGSGLLPGTGYGYLSGASGLSALVFAMAAAYGQLQRLL